MTGGAPGRLGEIGESIGDALLKRTGRIAARVQERRSLASDLLESETAYLVVFDAPGTTGSDVQVRFDDGAVEVRVDRFREFHEGFDMRFPGRGLSLDGRVELPDSAVIEPDRASATLTRRGTLEIHLPKGEEAPERTELDDQEDEFDVELGDRVTTVDKTDDSGPGGDDSTDGDAGSDATDDEEAEADANDNEDANADPNDNEDANADPNDDEDANEDDARK